MSDDEVVSSNSAFTAAFRYFVNYAAYYGAVSVCSLCDMVVAGREETMTDRACRSVRRKRLENFGDL